MVFSKVGPNQSIEWGQIKVSKSTVLYQLACAPPRRAGATCVSVTAQHSKNGRVMAREMRVFCNMQLESQI